MCRALILELQVTKRLMSDTNGFSASRARIISAILPKRARNALSWSMLRSPTHQLVVCACVRCVQPAHDGFLRRSLPRIRTLFKLDRRVCSTALLQTLDLSASLRDDSVGRSVPGGGGGGGGGGVASPLSNALSCEKTWPGADSSWSFQ